MLDVLEMESDTLTKLSTIMIIQGVSKESHIEFIRSLLAVLDSECIDKAITELNCSYRRGKTFSTLCLLSLCIERRLCYTKQSTDLFTQLLFRLRGERKVANLVHKIDMPSIDSIARPRKYP
jgi:hypothetical protein